MMLRRLQQCFRVGDSDNWLTSTFVTRETCCTAQVGTNCNNCNGCLKELALFPRSESRLRVLTLDSAASHQTDNLTTRTLPALHARRACTDRLNDVLRCCVLLHSTACRNVPVMRSREEEVWGFEFN